MYEPDATLERFVLICQCAKRAPECGHGQPDPGGPADLMLCPDQKTIRGWRCRLPSGHPGQHAPERSTGNWGPRVPMRLAHDRPEAHGVCARCGRLYIARIESVEPASAD